MDVTLQTLAELAAARRGGRTVAVAESFTAGLLAQALAAAPGSGEFFRGGVVAYDPSVKWDVLGVARGPVVTESAAAEMAAGAARLLDAAAALATTGVAGPGEQEGRPAGTVVIGWSVDGTSGAETMFLPGDPEQVVLAGARAALTRLAAALTEADHPLSTT